MLGNTNLPAVGIASEPFIRTSFTSTGGGGGEAGVSRNVGMSSAWGAKAANNSLSGSRTKMSSLGPQLKPSLAQIAKLTVSNSIGH